MRLELLYQCRLGLARRNGSPDEIFARRGYGTTGSGGFLPARVSLSHCFHSGVW
jgi:hypothetical protein